MQTMNHTWWTPIICKKCNSKLNFDSISWFKITAPLMLLAVISFIVLYATSTNILIKGLPVVVILLIGALVKFIFDLKSIKLKLK
jgi:hypothetical protein